MCSLAEARDALERAGLRLKPDAVRALCRLVSAQEDPGDEYSRHELYFWCQGEEAQRVLRGSLSHLGLVRPRWQATDYMLAILKGAKVTTTGFEVCPGRFGAYELRLITCSVCPLQEWCEGGFIPFRIALGGELRDVDHTGGIRALLDALKPLCEAERLQSVQVSRMNPSEEPTLLVSVG
jgi:hypothetical protein